MKAFFLVALVLLLPYDHAALPNPVGYVNDFAGILPNAAQLDQQLHAYEKNTTIEIAVVTIDALPADQNIYTYSVELFQR